MLMIAAITSQTLLVPPPTDRNRHLDFRGMAQESISTLFSSWTTDLDGLVDIEDLGAPAGSHRVVQWTKAQVRQRFSNTDLKIPGILCPRLPPFKIPVLGINLNNSRNNSAASSQHTTRDPMWLGHYMLIQNGVFATTRCDIFETYFEIKEGTMLILSASQPMSDDERRCFEQDPIAIKDVDFKTTTTLLRRDEYMVLPAFTLYHFEVTEHTLVVTGHIVPYGQAGGND